VEPGILLAFLESARQDAEAINEELRSAGNAENYRSHLDSIFRRSHSIKGDAQLLDLDFLAEQAESLEQKIVGIRNKKQPEGEDFLPLAVSCSNLLSIIEKLDVIVGKWLRLSDTVRLSVGTGNYIADSLKEMAQRLAGRYGKLADLEIAGFEEQDFKPDKQKALKDILVQLVRNSIYHGIETPEQRIKAGKSEGGAITIKAETIGGALRIVFRDDGAGIDGEKIKNKAVKAGLISREKAATMTGQESALLIFHSGFSTAGSPDEVAGKGIGLSLVKTRVQELKGKLSLKSRLGSYSEFILMFPLQVLQG
jgi:Amt family ammonium transporter